MSSTDWPEGVIARYLTIAGATVDIDHDTLHLTDTEPNVTGAFCTGCGTYENFNWSPRSDRLSNGSTCANGDAREWAQKHAESCRAMLKPDGAR